MSAGIPEHRHCEGKEDLPAEALIDPKTHTKARGMTFGNILRTGPLLSQRKWRLRERGGKRGGLEREQSESQG